MTVLAWDGTTLAADKRAIIGRLQRTTRKIYSVCVAPGGVPPVLVGYAGDASDGDECLAWFRAGAKPDDFPPPLRTKEDWSGLLVIWGGGEIWRYESSPYPVQFEPQIFASGSGRDFALAAMHCGKTAAEAVEIASFFDPNCGNGVDVLTHAGDPT